MFFSPGGGSLVGGEREGETTEVVGEDESHSAGASSSSCLAGL